MSPPTFQSKGQREVATKHLSMCEITLNLVLCCFVYTQENVILAKVYKFIPTPIRTVISQHNLHSISLYRQLTLLTSEESNPCQRLTLSYCIPTFDNLSTLSALYTSLSRIPTRQTYFSNQNLSLRRKKPSSTSLTS